MLVSLCVPSAGYASCLLDYVLRFAGCESAPMTQFIESVGEHVQCNVTLGETFWTEKRTVGGGSEVLTGRREVTYLVGPT